MDNEALYKINSLVSSVFYDNTEAMRDWNSTNKQRALNNIIKKVMKLKNRRKRMKKLTAYNVFYKDQVPLIRREFPDILCQDIMPEAARRWNYYKTHDIEYLRDKYGYKVNNNNTAASMA